MRKFLIPLIVLLLASPALAGCGGQPVQTEAGEKDVKSYVLRNESSDFAFGLFHGVASADYSANIVLSPVSAKLALAMTYNGASGETKEAMAEVLDLGDMSLKEVNEQLGNLIASLQQDDEALLIEIADSLWADQDCELSQDFVERCRQSYDAEVATLDFSDPDTPDTINAWAREKTHDKIDSIVDKIDPDVALILISAVYFNGKWALPFDPSLTADGDFHLPDGGTVIVPLMHRSGEFSYFENEALQAVSLPYGEEDDGRLSMCVVLPREGKDYGEFLGSLNEADWERWMGMFQSREGELALPRFKVEYEKELSDALRSMGMEPAFEGGLEDMFVSTGENWAGISKVLQKTYIDVNEEGTEAAAVTSVEVQWCSAPSEPFTMTVDRPFLFAIRDNQTGALLFLGSIVDPS